MKHTCEFCKKDFSSKSNLLFHKKNARYCVESRGKDPAPNYTCEFCDSSLANKYSLRKHYLKCSARHIKEIKDEYSEKLTFLKKENRDIKRKNIKLVKELEELKEELSEQKGVVSGLQKAPGKTYNAYIHPKLINLPINNIRALTDEFIQEKVDDGILTYNHAARGYPGILEVIGELITHENNEGEIERNYVCTDVSRNSFHRLDCSKVKSGNRIKVAGTSTTC
uniref:C2H2-type domain-containing protein n=1 Tax=Marseillevirus LCMAC101 TaxID=2506602 RepID=A0A481YS46_9VIRU|nr:MAG: hypothetical protein LCMAC101_03650 [Marseillevirus LCMAC101]